MKNFESDLEYRNEIKNTFHKIEKSLENEDPDILEAIQNQGSLTLLLEGKHKIILSPQPPVMQLWLAAAHLGEAVHFDFDGKTNSWVDDKGRGIELKAFLEKLLNKNIGLL